MQGKMVYFFVLHEYYYNNKFECAVDENQHQWGLKLQQACVESMENLYIMNMCIINYVSWFIGI
jgi:hypothetical protein